MHRLARQSRGPDKIAPVLMVSMGVLSIAATLAWALTDDRACRKQRVGVE